MANVVHLLGPSLEQGFSQLRLFYSHSRKLLGDADAHRWWDNSKGKQLSLPAPRGPEILTHGCAIPFPIFPPSEKGLCASLAQGVLGHVSSIDRVGKETAAGKGALWGCLLCSDPEIVLFPLTEC